MCAKCAQGVMHYSLKEKEEDEEEEEEEEEEGAI